jgi:hypothetical protein
MGYKFSLALSREVTDSESVVLQKEGCAGAVFSTGSHPANPEVVVTQVDFDDMVSPTLAEAIESALEAVKKVPDLSVPGLTVPAQPAEPPAAETSQESDSKAGGNGAEKPAAKKSAARRPAAKKGKEQSEAVVGSE